MCTERPAFGERLENIVELGAIACRTESLDAIGERHLKTIWAARTCPNCSEDTF